MKKHTLIICLFIFVIMNTACQPTPTEEIVVNKGDGSFEDLILVTANPNVPQEHPSTNSDNADSLIEETALTWDDYVESANLVIPIHAEIITNGHPCPIRKAIRHSFVAEEVVAVAEAMIPDVNAYWNSTDISRQEYEEALASLSSQGYVETAKEVFDIMSTESIPDEEFTPINSVIIGSNHRSQTYLYRTDKYATINYQDNRLIIDTRRHAVVHTAELLATDGHFEGQGPISLSPPITRESAQSMLVAFLDKIGLDGYIVCDAEEASYYGIINRTEYSQGWYFALVHTNEYIPIDLQKNGLGTTFRYDSNDIYNAPWHNESMYAYVDESGVASFGWYDPVEVVEIINSDVEILPLDVIKVRIKNMLSVGLSWLSDLRVPYGETGVVRKLVLTQTIIPVKNEFDAAYLMPTWVVVTDWYGPAGIYNYTDYTCFNAVDGSPISLKTKKRDR